MTPEGQRGRLLRVLISGDGGRRVSTAGLAAWLKKVAPAGARGSVGVALVGDARVRALNRRYRRKNHATDVLSFPLIDRAPSKTGRPQPDVPPGMDPEYRTHGPYLGDIVIARGVARRQARAAGHSERTELRILALHGLLHLLGYDHDRDRGRMARFERALRRRGGLREGLIERERGT
jgi:probable rRNA maturation factor